MINYRVGGGRGYLAVFIRFPFDRVRHINATPRRQRVVVSNAHAHRTRKLRRKSCPDAAESFISFALSLVDDVCRR